MVDFFKNLIAALNILRIVYQNATTGKLMVNGTSIDPYETTLSGFASAVVGDYANGIELRITDLHTTSAGVGGVRFTGGTSWVLTSPRIYFATFVAAVAAFPPATWPHLVIRCGDVGNGLVDLESNGTRYVPQGGVACLFKGTWGTLASPTNTITSGTGDPTLTFPIGTPTFPAGLFATGDSFRVKGRFQRHLTNATMLVRVNLGTAGNGNDHDLWNSTLVATNLLISPLEVHATVSDATHFLTNQSSGQSGGGSTSSAIDRTNNFNTASVMKLSASIQTKNASDSLDIMDLSFDWIAV